MQTFTQKVIKIVKKIPRGSTMSYAQVVKRAGSPGASRAVGSIMAKNADINVPCHRIIRSDGGIGPYNGLRGPSKEEILRQEGFIE